MKGAFFTLGAFLLIFVVFSTFVSINRFTYLQDEGIQTRIMTLESFLKDSVKDFERALFISSSRSLIALSERVILTGIPLENLSYYDEALIFGTFNGEELYTMQNSSLSNWEGRVNIQGSKIKANLNISILNVSIGHKSAKIIETNVTIDFVLIDKTVKFSKELIISSEVSIEGLEDPIYPLNTLGRVINTINFSHPSDFIPLGDPSILLDHSLNGYYIEHADAPSFLLRLQGKNNASPYGIESLVYLPSLTSQNILIKQKSIVDYIYFSDNSPSSSSVSGLPSWFRIDSIHEPIYDINN